MTAPSPASTTRSSTAFVDDNIEYKVVVIDMRDKANDSATTAR